jgi:N,N-dimethylformamidase
VVTDEIVHREGAELLGRYPVVLTGTHPEYMSAAEFDALDAYVRGGGRLMYLGGNGFASNVSFDEHRPWIMENRRVDFWMQGEDARHSESHNSTDGLRGGDLRRIGRESVQLTGVETATMGFDRSYPYHREPGSHDPAAAFVFAGVSGDVLGDFGLLGGGVVGQEWDNSAGHDRGPEFLLLAASRDHTLVPPLFGAVKPQYHGELTLGFPGRGCVFSVSSMSWCGALSQHDYRNDIATITGNVLRRFLDPAPLVPPTKGASDARS